MDKIKFKLFNKHIAYINKELLEEVQKKRVIFSFPVYFKELVYENFNLVIKTEEDIESLKEILYGRYYDNISEWINEKLREELKDTVDTSII